jgi:hypothetical protein
MHLVIHDCQRLNTVSTLSLHKLQGKSSGEAPNHAADDRANRKDRPNIGMERGRDRRPGFRQVDDKTCRFRAVGKQKPRMAICRDKAAVNSVVGHVVVLVLFDPLNSVDELERSCSLAAMLMTNPRERIRMMVPSILPRRSIWAITCSPGSPLTGAASAIALGEILTARHAYSRRSPRAFPPPARTYRPGLLTKMQISRPLSIFWRSPGWARSTGMTTTPEQLKGRRPNTKLVMCRSIKARALIFGQTPSVVP